MTTFPRRLEPEWLDELPTGDRRAVRARRDLRVLNRIMGHGFILGRALRLRATRESPRIAELGAGDGTLLLRIARRMRFRGDADIVLVDRQPAVTTDTLAGYGGIGCRVRIAAADAFDWLTGEAQYDAIVANLFLHHFDASALARLFSMAAARTAVFVACEPRRARFPLAGSHMLGLIGCNDVTRHDAVLSVRAGFTGSELSALWPPGAGWTLEERRAGMFSHLFVARRGDTIAPPPTRAGRGVTAAMSRLSE
jgi:SAM-dependent methyltransferase